MGSKDAPANICGHAVPVADLSPQTTTPIHEIILGEEELSDVSLSTFYVFDNPASSIRPASAIADPGE